MFISQNLGEWTGTESPIIRALKNLYILINNSVEFFWLLKFLLKSANFVFSLSCTASCCHRSLCMIVAFRFLVNHFVSSFTSDSMFVSMSGFRRQMSAALKPQISYLFYFSNLHDGFVEKFSQLLLYNFLMLTYFQVQFTLPVESNLQVSFKLEIKWL